MISRLKLYFKYTGTNQASFRYITNEQDSILRVCVADKTLYCYLFLSHVHEGNNLKTHKKAPIIQSSIIILYSSGIPGSNNGILFVGNIILGGKIIG